MAISGVSSSFSNISVGAHAQDRAQQLLKQVDTDQDGQVSKQEFTAFGENMKANGPRRPQGAQPPGAAGTNAPAPPSADEMFAKADTDGDGSLSIENLSAMISEHETHAAARGGHAGGPAPGGGKPPGGPPPGGGKPPAGAGGAAGAKSDSSSVESDPADTDGDGTVSAAEKLIYELSHPNAAADA